MAKIPKFKTSKETAEFWDTHDFEGCVGDTEPVTITVKVPQRKKRLTVSVDAEVYAQIEALAAKRGESVEKMLSEWLKEKALAELAAANKPDKRAVAKAVRKYLEDCHPGGATLEVIEEGIRQEEYWWYVPVRPNVEPPKWFEYYEALADVEEALDENESLTVFLIPTNPE